MRSRRNIEKLQREIEECMCSEDHKMDIKVNKMKMGRLEIKKRLV